MRHAVICVVTAWAIALPGLAGAQCTGGRCAGDNDGDGLVEIAELIAAVNVALEGCTAAPCQAPMACSLPASGQTQAYGPGSDGDMPAGAALSYTDNGDGTITDQATGLIWEKKDDAGGIHDKDNVYTWSAADSSSADGSLFVEFLAGLNAAAGCPNCSDVTATSCSCTALQNYWSSTTYISSPDQAWYVGFTEGQILTSFKNIDRLKLSARAVRSGP